MPLSDLIKGQTLSLQGYGSGIWKQEWGILSELEYRGGWRKITGANARSGDSGGPIIDTLGRYAGTLWGSREGETYFTPASTVAELVSEYLEPDKPLVVWVLEKYVLKYD